MIYKQEVYRTLRQSEAYPLSTGKKKQFFLVKLLFQFFLYGTVPSIWAGLWRTLFKFYLFYYLLTMTT